MEDTYMKESFKSYQKCHVANSARRNSLMKKTIGIEAQRKLASHQLDREEKLLREQLKSMKIEQAKSKVAGAVRGRTYSESNGQKSKGSLVPKEKQPDCIDPYPVTFGGKGPADSAHRQRSMTMVDKVGLRYNARRGRRVSNEFEDLSVNTKTGNLAIPSHLLIHLGSRSPSSSGTPSPSTPRRGMSCSNSSLESTEGCHWAGDPEAIQSVRRPRKSVGQQDKERLMRMKGEVSPKRVRE